MAKTELDKYLEGLVNKILDEREIGLKKEDAQKIVEEIIPQLDKLISDRVKEHFVQLADHIKEKFSVR